MEKLTGLDYITRPFLELMSHPDFSMYAYHVMIAMGKMNTEEIEKINLIGDNNG